MWSADWNVCDFNQEQTDWNVCDFNQERTFIYVLNDSRNSVSNQFDFYDRFKSKIDHEKKIKLIKKSAKKIDLLTDRSFIDQFHGVKGPIGPYTYG